MVEGGALFFAQKDRILNDEQHLAEMVSLMGPPPPEFLQRSEKCRQFWDDQGASYPSLCDFPLAMLLFSFFFSDNVIRQAPGKAQYQSQNNPSR
jgi:hypothetical protein